MTRGESRIGREKKTVKADYDVGSSNGDGIRFTCPDHPDKSDLHSPERK